MCTSASGQSREHLWQIIAFRESIQEQEEVEEEIFNFSIKFCPREFYDSNRKSRWILEGNLIN